MRARRRSSDDSQDSRVEERRRAALAATRELRERLFVYRPALDYKRTTKMTLTPSRYKESVCCSPLSKIATYTARKSALSCARSHSPRHIISPPACPPLATAREWYIRESQHTKEEHEKKSFTATCPKSTKTRPTPPELGPLTHAARAPGTIRHICTRDCRLCM